MKHGLTDGISRITCICVILTPSISTPYAYGLFVFDIRLGPPYPNDAPLVKYHHRSSDKCNLNLYIDGNICLSLLGTWEGKDKELWTLDASVLQVLQSLRSLVLNENHYFNEADYTRVCSTFDTSTASERLLNEHACCIDDVAGIVEPVHHADSAI